MDEQQGDLSVEFSGSVHDLMPDDALAPLAGVRIIRYLGSEGESNFRYKVDGDIDTTTLLGMLSLVQVDIALGTLQYSTE